MKEIEAITKLATFQMICDGEADNDEVAILNNLPQRMAEHINEWDGNVRIRITISIGGRSSSRGSNEDELISKEELVEIINTTVQEYNDLPEEGDELDNYLINICSFIEDEDLRFHVLKLLVDLSAADGEFHENELEWLSELATLWGIEEDLSDFLFMKTSNEWEWKNGYIHEL